MTRSLILRSPSDWKGKQLTVEFFFFQAEDGIRDHCVTGVQTCALPIYATAGSQSLGDRVLEPRAFQTAQKIGDVLSVECQSRLGGQDLPERRRDQRLSRWHRSEERRVGKECRSRGSTGH